MRESTTYNIGLTKGELMCFYNTFMLNQTVVLPMYFGAKDSAFRHILIC